MRIIYGILGRGIFPKLVEAKREFFETDIAVQYDFRPKIDNSAFWFAEAKIEELELENFVLDLAHYYKQFVIGSEMEVIRKQEEESAIIMGNGFACALDTFKMVDVSAEQTEMILNVVRKFNDMEVITPATSEKYLKKVVGNWATTLMKNKAVHFFFKQKEMSFKIDGARICFDDDSMVFDLGSWWDKETVERGVAWLISKKIKDA